MLMVDSVVIEWLRMQRVRGESYIVLLCSNYTAAS